MLCNQLCNQLCNFICLAYKNSMKMTSAIDPVIMENMEDSVVKISTTFNNQEENVCTIMLHYQLLKTLSHIPNK